MVEAVVLRSQMAHARFRVDLGAARRGDGVVAAFSAQDLVDASPLPEFVEWARPVGRVLPGVRRGQPASEPRSGRQVPK